MENSKNMIPESILKKIYSIASKISYSKVDEYDIDEKYILEFLDFLVSNQLNNNSSLKINTKQSSPKNEIESPSQIENSFLAKAAAVESELMLMKHQISDIQLLKTKLQQQQYYVKQSKLELIEEMGKHDKTKKKLQILTDHVEKLVKILKYESTAKIKGLEHIRELKKEMRRNEIALKNKSKVVNSQSKLIRELREGAKILEDQLRIMDEKFLDVRFKLDGVRHQQKTIVAKAEAEAHELRVKFALSQGKGRMKTLDSIQLPVNLTNSIDFGNSSPVPIGEAALKSSHFIDRPQTSNERIKTNRQETKRRPTSAAAHHQKNVQKELDDVILKIHRKQKNNQVPWTKERLDLLVNYT